MSIFTVDPSGTLDSLVHFRSQFTLKLTLGEQLPPLDVTSCCSTLLFVSIFFGTEDLLVSASHT